jgi:transcriptional regulator with XRE-family HTH domain
MSIDAEPTRTAQATLSERVGMEIKVQMVRAGISGRRLALRLGVSQSWISTRLTGTTPIDLNELELVAEVLGIDATELLRRAAQSAGPQATAHYPDLTVRPTKVASHPRNRPAGPSSSTRPPTVRRTARLPRDKAA